MSISRSRDGIQSSLGGRSSTPSRNRHDCPFQGRSGALARIVDRWMARIFAANHAHRPLASSGRIDRGDQTLPRVRRRSAVRPDLAGVRDIAPRAVWPLGGPIAVATRPGELHEETK
jgi:hypothetical protein